MTFLKLTMDYHGMTKFTKINGRTPFFNSMKSMTWKMPAGMKKEVCLQLLQLHNHLNVILVLVAIVVFVFYKAFE